MVQRLQADATGGLELVEVAVVLRQVALADEVVFDVGKGLLHGGQLGGDAAVVGERLEHVLAAALQGLVAGGGFLVAPPDEVIGDPQEDGQRTGGDDKGVAAAGAEDGLQEGVHGWAPLNLQATSKCRLLSSSVRSREVRATVLKSAPSSGSRRRVST